MAVVKVHCGSQHVASKARKYSYYIASIFDEYITNEGRRLYYNLKINTPPRRSFKKATIEGQQLARQYGAKFIDGYGSLHNQPVVK